MKCLFCQRDIEPSMKYCPHCGKSVVEPSAADVQKNASVSGAQNAADASLAQTVVFGSQMPADMQATPPEQPAAAPVESGQTAFPPIFNPATAEEVVSNNAAPAAAAASVPPATPQVAQPTMAPASPQNTPPVSPPEDPFAAVLAADKTLQRSGAANAEADAINNVLHYENPSQPLQPQPAQFSPPPSSPPPPPIGRGPQEIPEKKNGGSRKTIIIVSVIAATLLITALVYFLFFHSKISVTQTTKTIEAGTDVDMLTLIEVKDRENYDITVKSNDVNLKQLGEYKVVYTISPKKNQNEKDFEFLFTVQDTTPPQINVQDTIAVLKDQPLSLMDQVTITDNLDGTIDPSAIIMEGSPNTATVGTYPVTLSVTDKSGNKATKEISILVEDKSNPVTFINQIKYTWEFISDPQQVLVIKEEDNKYLMFVGYKESEGYGGQLVLNNIAPDNSTATATWYFDDEGTETPLEVKFDLGISGDGKMKVNYGQGWEEVKIYN